MFSIDFKILICAEKTAPRMLGVTVLKLRGP
jgi:hypothetical protein